jgi:hypothetical protein
MSCMCSGCGVAWCPSPQFVVTSLPLAACRPDTSLPIIFPGPTIGREARVAILS